PMAGKLIIYGATGYTGQLVSEQAKRAGRDAEKIRAAGRLHGMISNDAILSPSTLKKNRRSTGLPGKLPTRWLVTTVFPSFSSHAIGSLVYSYFAEASVFQSLIAARPLWVWPSSSTTAFSVKHCETASPSPSNGHQVMTFVAPTSVEDEHHQTLIGKRRMEWPHGAKAI